MKQAILIFGAFIGLLPAQIVFAQGTIYLSNMGQPQGNSGMVARDSWIAQRFQTGTNLDGYALNAIQLLMDQATGGANGFSASLYTSVSGLPGIRLVGFNGLDPAASGIYTYTASNIVLSPSTSYCVVFTAATPITQGSYYWNKASGASFSASESWSLAPFSFSSTDGSDWLVQRLMLFQFAVEATAIPEPSISALVGLGLVGLSFWKRK